LHLDAFKIDRNAWNLSVQTDFLSGPQCGLQRLDAAVRSDPLPDGIFAAKERGGLASRHAAPDKPHV